SDGGGQKDVRQSRLVQRRLIPPDGRTDCDVHAAFRHFAHVRLVGAYHRAAHGQQDHPPGCELHRAGESPFHFPQRAIKTSMTYLSASDLPSAPAGERFRALINRTGIVQIPGAHNGIAALQAKAVGFEALYLSGAAMSASMGLPDLGVITV